MTIAGKGEAPALSRTGASLTYATCQLPSCCAFQAYHSETVDGEAFAPAALVSSPTAPAAHNSGGGLSFVIGGDYAKGKAQASSIIEGSLHFTAERRRAKPEGHRG